MRGRKYDPEPTAIEKLRDIANKLSVIAEKVAERTEVIAATKVTQPKMANVKNAERALGYLNGYSHALVTCMDDLEAEKKAKARANQALDAEAKANKRSRKSSN